MENINKKGQYTLLEESVWVRNFCSFWKICKSLFPQKVRSIVNRKSFFLQNVQNFSTAKVYCRKKASDFEETRKFFFCKMQKIYRKALSSWLIEAEILEQN